MKKIFALVLALATAALAVQNMTVAASSLDAAQEALTVVSRGFNTTTFQITGTWSATITFEGTLTGGTYVAIPGVNKNTGASATTTTANGIYDVSSHGLLNVRARVSAYTSGTAVVMAQALEGVGLFYSGGGAASSVNVSQWAGASATGGAGSVASGTPRVTLASDDPAVVLLGNLAFWDESARLKVNLISGQAGVAGNSGTVGATTQRVVLATDVALPAGTNLLGRVSSSGETSTIYNGTTALTPKFAIIDAASSGDNTLVSAVASNKIRVLALYIVAAGAVNTRFESGAGGTALSGQMNLTTNSGFSLPYNPVGWFETASNTLLNLELSGAVSVDGSLVYVEVP